MSRLTSISVSLLFIVLGLYILKAETNINNSRHFQGSSTDLNSEREPILKTTPQNLGNNIDFKPQDKNSKPQISSSQPNNTDLYVKRLDNAQRLWKHQSSVEVGDDDIKRYQFLSEKSLLNDLNINQRIEIELPDLNLTAEAQLLEHYNVLNKVDIWKGPIVNLGQHDNITLAKGALQTHIIITTEYGTFSGYIDNETGETSLVNENDANPGIGHESDFIHGEKEDHESLSPAPKELNQSF